jgi:predicted transcriptional regulator
MTLTIHLSPELETRLREAAEHTGLNPDAYVLRILEQQLPGPETNHRSLWNTLTPEEWMRAFDEWANSHDPSVPLLSDEAVSRESFYEGRP